MSTETAGCKIIWNDVRVSSPEPMVEVLVWIDGHRGPQWRNNHALVAYMDYAGEWHEHYTGDPLNDVIAWSPITYPDAWSLRRPSWRTRQGRRGR